MSSPSPMKSIGVLIGVLVTVFVLYLLVAGSITLVLKTKIGQGDPKGFWYTDRDKLKKYIFKSWIDWAGAPATFSYLEFSEPASYTVLKTITGTSAKLANCMIQCESSDKCDGFIFNKSGSSNTCTLVTGMDVLIMGSNTMYFVDGKEPAKQFGPILSNTISTPTYVIGTPYTASNYNDCASNCISNVSCNGFTFDTSSKNCGLVTNYNENGPRPAAGTTLITSKLIDHLPFTASTTSYYSTK